MPNSYTSEHPLDVVLSKSQARGFERLILVTLAWLQDDKDEVVVSVTELAKASTTSNGSVVNAIKALEDRGEIQVVHGHGHVKNRYRVTVS